MQICVLMQLDNYQRHWDRLPHTVALGSVVMDGQRGKYGTL